MQTAIPLKTSDFLQARIAPLTRVRPNGEKLTRPPEIENEIGEIIELDWSEVSVRLKISDKESSEFITEEVLVFLLRAAIYSGETAAANEISDVLFDRTENRIKGYARKLVPENYFTEAVSDMLGDLFMNLCDLTTDKHDFAQVRFWQYLKRVCGERWRKYQAHGKINEQSVFLDQQDDNAGPIKEIVSTSEVYSATDLNDIKNALNILPQPLRSAFFLRHYEGVQIESNKPDEITLSRIFGKTDRTIRNWLTRADELLENWRNGGKL